MNRWAARFITIDPPSLGEGPLYTTRSQPKQWIKKKKKKKNNEWKFVDLPPPASASISLCRAGRRARTSTKKITTLSRPLVTFVPYSSLGVTFLARCVRGCSSIRLNELYVSFATISPRIVSGALLLLCARARASVRRTGRREENSKSDTCCCCCCASSLFTVALSLIYYKYVYSPCVFSFFLLLSLSISYTSKKIRSCALVYFALSLRRPRSEQKSSHHSPEERALCRVFSPRDFSFSLSAHQDVGRMRIARERAGSASYLGTGSERAAGDADGGE